MEYVTSCRAVSPRVASRLVVSCLVSRRVLSCLVVTCRVVSCTVVSYPIMSCVLCCAVPCIVVSCRIVSCCVLSCRVVSCIVLCAWSCLVLSWLVLSCRVVSQLTHYFIPGRCAFPLHLQIYCYTTVTINKEDTNYSAQRSRFNELDRYYLRQSVSNPERSSPYSPLCLPHTTNSGSTKRPWTLDYS